MRASSILRCAARTLAVAALVLPACGGSNDSSSSSPLGAAPPYDDCYAPDQLVSSDVAGHHCTWLHEGLMLQERLDRERTFGDIQWHATHNSFNSAAYTDAGYFDFNQVVSISDQFELGVRTIELDAHWYASDAAGGAPAPVLCHAQGADIFQIGCSKKARPFAAGVQEVADFLAKPGNEQTVLVVGVEDVLEEHVPPDGARPVPEGYDQVAATFESILGPDIYHPPQDGTCHPLPLDLTKAQVLAAGARVLVTSDCGVGTAWTNVLFEDKPKKQGNDGFTPYPDCDSAFYTAEDYATLRTRAWEDSTFISSLVDPDVRPIDPPTLTAMRGCGLNEVALDKLRPDDDRATAMVWSWAAGEPRRDAGALCAFSQADGHFATDACESPRRVACRSNGGWAITADAVAWSDAANACATSFAADASFAVPRTGFENSQLKDAKTAAGTAEVWLDYSDTSGRGRWLPAGS